MRSGSQLYQEWQEYPDRTGKPFRDENRIAWFPRPGSADHIFYTAGLPEPDAATLAAAALATLAGVASRRRGRSLRR